MTDELQTEQSTPSAQNPLTGPHASLALTTTLTSQIHHWSIPQRSSHLLPEHEQGKISNFCLISCHSNRCPFHLPTFTTPSPFNSGYTKSRGCTADPGKESLLYLHLQEFNLGHMEPRQKKTPAFSCPTRSNPPQGPDV